MSKRTDFRTMPFDQMVRQYTGTIQCTLRSYGFTGADLEDITQDVFLKVFEGNYQSLYDPSKGAPSTFLQSLARRYALQNHSKRQRTPSYGALSITESSGDDVEVGECPSDYLGCTENYDDVDFRIVCEMIRRSLGEVPQRGKRDLVALFDYLVEGYNQKDIAGFMGLSRSTIFYMVKDLRDVLEERGYRQVLSLEV